MHRSRTETESQHVAGGRCLFAAATAIGGAVIRTMSSESLLESAPMPPHTYERQQAWPREIIYAAQRAMRLQNDVVRLESRIAALRDALQAEESRQQLSNSPSAIDVLAMFGAVERLRTRHGEAVEFASCAWQLVQLLCSVCRGENGAPVTLRQLAIVAATLLRAEPEGTGNSPCARVEMLACYLEHSAGTRTLRSSLAFRGEPGIGATAIMDAIVPTHRDPEESPLPTNTTANYGPDNEQPPPLISDDEEDDASGDSEPYARTPSPPQQNGYIVLQEDNYMVGGGQGSESVVRRLQF